MSVSELGFAPFSFDVAISLPAEELARRIARAPLSRLRAERAPPFVEEPGSFTDVVGTFLRR